MSVDLASIAIVISVLGFNLIGDNSGSGFVSTMQLASGASIGTLSGLGSQFVDFAQVTVDANAVWSLSGFRPV
jgi:ABC-type dipeptide/oligopeptide/nickel transport system permease subunit